MAGGSRRMAALAPAATTPTPAPRSQTAGLAQLSGIRAMQPGAHSVPSSILRWASAPPGAAAYAAAMMPCIPGIAVQEQQCTPSLDTVLTSAAVGVSAG